MTPCKNKINSTYTKHSFLIDKKFNKDRYIVLFKAKHVHNNHISPIFNQIRRKIRNVR